MTATRGLALMLGGGGARGAYQAGVLRGIARQHPDLRFPILTGISAGALNTAHLASSESAIEPATEALIRLWRGLHADEVYDVRSLPVLRNVLRWGMRLVSGGMGNENEPIRGMLDTAPLRRFLDRALPCAPDGSLPGIGRNLERGRLHAVALSATSYTTGDSVTWVEGRDVDLWQRPQRRTEAAHLTIDHVMASSALPMLFPAIEVGGQWFGDGGIRLTAPLSPALHLGAERILTISTRPGAVGPPSTRTGTYPPPAQVFGVLYGAVFADLIDEDARRLRTVNALLGERPVGEDGGMRHVDILVIRPSRNLRSLAQSVEPRLPPIVRYLTRGLGTQQATSAEFLSLLLFDPEYVRRLIEVGEEDAETNAESIAMFLEGGDREDGLLTSRRELVSPQPTAVHA